MDGEIFIRPLCAVVIHCTRNRHCAYGLSDQLAVEVESVAVDRTLLGPDVVPDDDESIVFLRDFQCDDWSTLRRRARHVDQLQANGMSA